MVRERDRKSVSEGGKEVLTKVETMGSDVCDKPWLYPRYTVYLG